MLLKLKKECELRNQKDVVSEKKGKKTDGRKKQ